jgi:hypothetical protein
VNAVEEEAKFCQHKRIGGIHEILLQARDRQKRTNSIDSIGVKDRQMISILNNLKDHFDSHGCLDRKGHLLECCKPSPLLNCTALTDSSSRSESNKIPKTAKEDKSFAISGPANGASPGRA